MPLYVFLNESSDQRVILDLSILGLTPSILLTLVKNAYFVTHSHTKFPRKQHKGEPNQEIPQWAMR